jgi:hypothetical protein
MSHQSFESVLLIAHPGESVTSLQNDHWRVRYPLIFDIFQRSKELEAAAFDPWHILTLQERAARELFLNLDWVLYPGRERRKKASGLEIVYHSAAETIATLLHAYLDAFDIDGLPLYRLQDSELIELSEFDEIGGTSLRKLIQVAQHDASSYASAPTWSPLLYHRRSDVYWHSLIAGDVWSGQNDARDPVQMYERQPRNHTTELRQRMIADQQAVRKKALQAVVRGQITMSAAGLSAGELRPVSAAHRTTPAANDPASPENGAVGDSDLSDSYWRAAKQLLTASPHRKVAEKLAQAIVDATSLVEQAARLQSVRHKNETLEYVEGKIRELKSERPASEVPRDVLHAAISLALLEAIHSVMGNIVEQLKGAKESGNSIDEINLDRVQVLVGAVTQQRRPKYFSDWIAFHGLTMESLKRTGPEHDYLYGLFCRAEEIEGIDRDSWQARTLLQRAELELFEQYEWLSHVSMTDSPHAHTWYNGKRLHGIEAIYENAAEFISSTLRSYLYEASDEGLPLFEIKNDVLSEIGDAEATQLLRDSKLSDPHGSCRQPPEWAFRLYHRHSDVYWHNLLSGDRTQSDRPERVSDQANARRAALRAVIDGRIQLQAAGLPAEVMNCRASIATSVSVTALQHNRGQSRRAPLLSFVEKVLNRDCPGLFDSTGSWPKQEAVKEWLERNCGLSARAAGAVAVVTQPK